MVCRKQTFADDKADLMDFKERFLKGGCGLWPAVGGGLYECGLKLYIIVCRRRFI